MIKTRNTEHNGLRAARVDIAKTQDILGQSDKKVVVKMKGGEGGRTFGSVSTKEIAAEAKAQLGLELDKKKMQLAAEEPVAEPMNAK